MFKFLSILKLSGNKREKCLETLSKEFLKLFLHWKPKFTLEEAAHKINFKKSEEKIRTKVKQLLFITIFFIYKI